MITDEKENLNKEMEKLLEELNSTKEKIKSLQQKMDEANDLDDQELDENLLEPVIRIEELDQELLPLQGNEKNRIVLEEDMVDLPTGWRWLKMNMTRRKTKYERLIRSPEGKTFYSILSAIQFMMRNRKLYNESDVQIMKKNLHLEGWRHEKFLPPEWQICEKRMTGMANQTRFQYLSDKLRYFQSTKAVLVFMEGNQYTAAQIEKLRSKSALQENRGQKEKLKASMKGIITYGAKEVDDNTVQEDLGHPQNIEETTTAETSRKVFLVPDVDPPEVEDVGPGEWEGDSESLPPGWQRRVNGVNKKEFIRSPSGSVFKSRFAALRAMMKDNCPAAKLSLIRQKMIEYEGWESSQLLPSGWMYKVSWEGFSKENRFQNSIIYLSREGNLYNSMKAVLNHLKMSREYSQIESEKCKKFLIERNKMTIERRFDWVDSDSVPRGWKVRSSGPNSKEYILSPEGIQYKSRFVAIQDLASKSYPEQILDDLRTKLVEHENWEISELLPEGWLFKVTWEGVGKEGRWNSNLCYLAREVVAFDSMKEVLSHLKSLPGYNLEDIQRCREFLKQRGQQTVEMRYSWQSTDSLPPGWRVRRSQGGNPVEFFLSPHNTQYKSRFCAVQDMMKRPDLYSSEEVELMKQKMIAEESWKVSPHLPSGWLYKIVWQGQGKTKMMQQNIWFLTREGFYFESMKAAREYIRNTEGYVEADDDRCQQFLDHQRKSTAKFKYAWEDGDNSVPTGWSRRITEGRMEFILSPNGDQFKSRLSALQAMIREKYPTKEVSQMRSLLHHEGWTNHKLLPKHWYYKRTRPTWNNRKMDYSFLSADGQHFLSWKSAIGFMIKSEYYSKKQINNFKILMRKEEKLTIQNSHTWLDAANLPSGWKTRAGSEGEGRQYYLSPGGEQFLTLLKVYQHLLSQGHLTAALHEVRTGLANEGWLESSDLPKYWLRKQVKSYDWYLDREGATHPNAKRALASIEDDSSYTRTEKDLVRKIVEDTQVRVEEKYNWNFYKELPHGWRVRRKTSRSRKMIEFYLAPDGKHIRGKTSAIQHLESLGVGGSEISKLKNFSFFKIRKNKKSTENTLEELSSERSDISLSSSFESNVSTSSHDTDILDQQFINDIQIQKSRKTSQVSAYKYKRQDLRTLLN